LALLHFEDFIRRILTVGDVDKVLEQWWVNLLVLGGDKHGCGPDQLHMTFAYHLERQVPIYNVNSQKKGLWQQLKVVVSLNEPIDKG
jgi:hypothetical protein